MPIDPAALAELFRVIRGEHTRPPATAAPKTQGEPPPATSHQPPATGQLASGIAELPGAWSAPKPLWKHVRGWIKLLGMAAGYLLSAMILFAGAWGIVQLHHWLFDRGPQPPGWACDGRSCEPAKGWHFEQSPVAGRIAVHDFPRSRAQRQRDIDTGELWPRLSNDERRQILDGNATIYDFFEVEHD